MYVWNNRMIFIIARVFLNHYIRRVFTFNRECRWSCENFTCSKLDCASVWCAVKTMKSVLMWRFEGTWLDMNLKYTSLLFSLIQNSNMCINLPYGMCPHLKKATVKGDFPNCSKLEFCQISIVNIVRSNNWNFHLLWWLWQFCT